MDALRIFLDGANRNRTLFVLLAGFALFPIYTGIADLPFWNDLAMRIMLLGLAAMGLELGNAASDDVKAMRILRNKKDHFAGSSRPWIPGGGPLPGLARLY